MLPKEKDAAKRIPELIAALEPLIPLSQSEE
jgi:hypothetical protein